MKAPIDKYRDPAGHRKRLRDRFLRFRREGFPDYELLELDRDYKAMEAIFNDVILKTLRKRKA